ADSQPCYDSCGPTRWFRITQNPGDITRVAIANAGFVGYLLVVEGNCPIDSLAAGGSRPFAYYQSVPTLATNETGQERTLYIALSSPAASANTVDLTFNTRQQGCGDGVRTSAEECDDGNLSTGDGCGSTCKVEGDSKWQCPEAGKPCASTASCGD